MHIFIETKTHYGQDHHYIENPQSLRDLWQSITGKKTVTQTDLDQLHALAQEFGSGLSSDRIRS